MLCVFSAIRYVTEANTVTANSSNFTSVTNGIIAYNGPANNNPIFISFTSFDKQMDSGYVYFINGKFVWNKKPNNGPQELQEVFVNRELYKIDQD
ncbi:5698_t:CDS:2 [Funneliformis mosseae]|uniref:5698_t:CDS:1 n=1 Tax=Funneliformis mosseae TaxID=27381 RepID=A0A9N9F6C1_FUNMO|nr:5698_t:CDS:2 [Funneliformis mosseae]